MRFPLTLRVHKPACQLGHGLRSHGSSGVRRVTAFASSNTQQEGLEKALETSSAIGTAAFNVLYDEAVDIAADASRVQAEHFKILSRFPEDPQGTVSEFIRDVQNRDVPSVSDLMNRTASVMSLIQSRVDEQLSESSPGFQDEKTVDENAPPEMPDPQVLGADVQAEAAAARRAVKKSVENQKI